MHWGWGTSLRMKRWMDASEKKKVKVNPEVTKLWGTDAGSSFAISYRYGYVSQWLMLEYLFKSPHVTFFGASLI